MLNAMRADISILLKAFFLVITFSLSACVSFPDAPEPIAPPVIAGNVVQSIDGALLGLDQWQAENPKAVIVAVHGMNDYAHKLHRNCRDEFFTNNTTQ